jgi:hypothetical protein
MQTYTYWLRGYENMVLRLQDALHCGGKVAVKEITEHEYIKGSHHE